ncbi:hypothetical protein [Gloeothece verrucosa]|uniref:Uncharacterized protein n=1 Tax=Gloeothece verrucosa (strain PCC 7822) TaxID=497965 RepID=E0UD74_GLOV7|nr:hypothetical protein [Gloeothece verrucosa]ADN12954.1 hypothetical protein Cyan7822_0940 [Gloeothece verrucosa PCC 7822]
MSTKISGLIPLLLRKSTILPAMRTFVEISLFYGGLISPHYMVISPEEIALLSVAFGGIVALLISRFRWNDHDVALWKLSKRSFFIPCAILFVLGWWLWRWWHLPSLLLKAGLTIFLVSTVLSLQHLESELTPEIAIAFLRRAAFIPFPIFLSILFNFFKLQ